MVLRIGHRGALGHVDENTLESVKKAVSLKCDMVEFDVRECKTGEIILMHNRSVNRTTNGKGFVRNKTYDQLKKLRTKYGYQIPTLDSVLKYLKGKCKIDIEMKYGIPVKDVVDLVEKHKLVNNVIITTYYDWDLKKVKKLNPKIKIMLLCEARLFLIARAKRLGCSGIIIRNNIKIKKGFVAKAHKNGLKVYSWPVNSPQDIKRLKEIGLDGLISNYPERV